jgi:hypothetical protein
MYLGKCEQIWWQIEINVGRYEFEQIRACGQIWVQLGKCGHNLYNVGK